MRRPRIDNFGGGSQGVNEGKFDGKSSGYLCGYPESVTLGVGRTVSEGANLMGNHSDTYLHTPNG